MQVLARPGMVERFVRDAETAALIRSCFAGLWSLDPADGDDTAVRLRAV